eukprot:CAMPEP_0179130014 /NCGR_PEP_ID=MMETSP0796-20121207/61708_1 /TAXON_ID=73915 /ORGANISM="Pyrodinium bahamense, Strain pbaha01" /LENGTH=681 /DNA_ID=CAMNT_0020828905 /DNA_START=139 /DNA_END=2184 /DNA_ORIENTATION=+
MLVIWMVGWMLLWKIDGAKYYYLQESAEASVWPSCKQILFPYDAMMVKIDYGTVGSGRKPTPDEIERLQLGREFYLSGAGGAQSGDSANYGSSWVYHGSDCSLDFVDVGNSKWLIMMQFENSTDPRQLPMPDKNQCGGSEPGEFFLRKLDMWDVKWIFLVWLSLKLVALYLEEATVYGFGQDSGSFSLMELAHDMRGRIMNCEPPCQAATCMGGWCWYPTFGPRTQESCAKARNARWFKKLQNLIFTWAPNVLLNPILSFSLHDNCDQLVSSSYSTLSVRFLNIAAAAMLASFIPLGRAMRAVRLHRERVPMTRDKIEEGTRWTQPNQRTDEEEEEEEEEQSPARRKVFVYRQAQKVVVLKQVMEDIWVQPESGNEAMRVSKYELYGPEKTQQDETYMPEGPVEQIEVGTTLEWRPPEVRGKSVYLLRVNGDSLKVEVERKKQVWEREDKFEAHFREIYHPSRLESMKPMTLVCKAVKSLWDSAREYLDMAESFLPMAKELFAKKLEEARTTEAVDCGEGCECCSACSMCPAYFCYGLLGCLQALCCLVAAAACVLWACVLFLVPLIPAFTILVLVVYELMCFWMRGVVFTFGFDFSWALWFSYPQFDLSLNLSMFRLFTFILGSLDILAQFSNTIVRCLSVANLKATKVKAAAESVLKPHMHKKEARSTVGEPVQIGSSV